MKERYTFARPECAERRSASTRRAPVSPLRSARMADVSRTNLGLLAIPATIRDQAAHRTRFARAAQGGDRIVRDRNDADGGSLNDPFERCSGRDLKLSPDSGRYRNLSALGHPRPHWSSSI